MKHLLLTLSLLCLVWSMAISQNAYNVGMLLDERTSETDFLITQLEREIRAVVGEDAVINFPEESILKNDFNLQLATENYNTLVNNNTDIILAFGAVNSLVITRQETLQKPTIFFGPINYAIAQVDSTQQSTGINNLTFLIVPQSFDEDLAKLKELTNFTSLGVVIEEPVTEILTVKQNMDRIVANLGVTYQLIPFETVNDITNNLDGVDAVYFAGGYFLTDDEIKEIAQVLIEKKIPSFTSTSIEDVDNGLMATNRPEGDLTQFFRRIALTIEAYVNGAPLADLPMYIESERSLTINFNTADQIGVPIKYSLIGETSFTGNTQNLRAEKTYNLLDAFNETLGRNLSLQSTKKNISLSQQDVKSAKSNYYPNITGSATTAYVDPSIANFFNPEFSTTGAITFEQLIFSQSANANITIQKNLLKAQEERFNSAELDAIFNISNAYFNILASKVNLQIQNQNVELTKQNLRIANQNFEAGQSGKLDVLRFRSELAQNTQAFVESINQLNQSFVLLNQLLNNPTDMEIDITDAKLGEGVFERYNYNQLADLLDSPDLREPFIAFLIDEAKTNSPDLKSLAYSIQATERNIQLNGRDRFFPTLAFQGQYNYIFDQSGEGDLGIAPTGNYNVGLSLSIPIFKQNQNNINKQTAIIQREQLDLDRQNLELSIATNISTTVLDLVNQIANIELSRISEETAQESLELTQNSYRNGAVNIIQLIDAQNNYLRAQLARANAEYNFILISLQIERFLSYNFLLHTPEENDAFRARFTEFLTNYNKD